jgi:regulator of sirC expression with transglutaminase-like and TPR domain
MLIVTPLGYDTNHVLIADPMLAYFERLCTQSDRDINLGEAALTIATEAYPELDIAEYERRLDLLAADLKPWTDAAPTGVQRVAVLCNRLLKQGGFRGDQDDYYDPRNSYLNDVLDRRRGIPISLAIVLIEVGRRLGIKLRGVGFPGHFLVRYDGEQALFIDACHEGTFLDEDACRRLLEHVTSGRMTFDKKLLAPVPKRRVLIRMLRNLKAIHVRRSEVEEAILTSGRLMALAPGQLTEFRDRGLLFFEANQWQPAADDLLHYLTQAGVGPDAMLVRTSLTVALDRAASERAKTIQ